MVMPPFGFVLRRFNPDPARDGIRRGTPERVPGRAYCRGAGTPATRSAERSEWMREVENRSRDCQEV